MIEAREGVFWPKGVNELVRDLSPHTLSYDIVMIDGCVSDNELINEFYACLDSIVCDLTTKIDKFKTDKYTMRNNEVLTQKEVIAMANRISELMNKFALPRNINHHMDAIPVMNYLIEIQNCLLQTRQDYHNPYIYSWAKRYLLVTKLISDTICKSMDEEQAKIKKDWLESRKKSEEHKQTYDSETV